MVRGVNESIDILEIKGIDKLEKLTPGISLSKLYYGYSNGKCFSDLLKNVKYIINGTLKEAGKMAEIISNACSGGYKDWVILSLINTETNKEYLEKIPHRAFEDLSIIYHICINAPSDVPFKNMVVTNDMINEMGITEEELYLIAKENTIRLLEPMVESMFEIMKRLIPDSVKEIDEPKYPMYVVSSKYGYGGAAFMLYDKIFDMLTQKIGEDILILPSSRHDFIAMPNCEDVEALANMVFEINITDVSDEDRLSNQVYRWNKDARKVEVVTHTQFQNLCM